MDVSEADIDIKLQKISQDLLLQFDQALIPFFRKPVPTDPSATSSVNHVEESGRRDTTLRTRVRSRELFRLTSSLLDPFQELPQLLDPHLPKWIPFLSETYLQLLNSRGRTGIATSSGSKKISDRSSLLVSAEFAVCKLLYTFCKIRGEKVIVRFLNVEAKYLELLVSAIEDAEEQASSAATMDGSTDQVTGTGTGEATDASGSTKWAWEQRYIVLLWISHLLLAPFDLSTISSVDIDDMTIPSIPNLTWPESLPGIALRVIPLGVRFLASPGRERDAAKALIVRISMRRDMQQLGLLDRLVEWALRSLRPAAGAPEQPTYFYLGVLSFLAGALRSSTDTSDMDKFLVSIFHTVHGISIEDNPASKSIIALALARKMIIKVLRSIIVSLLRQPNESAEKTELTETAIGYLLESVADSDTPVRLSASKSLSIITLKLDPFMASQVVEAVLESLNRNVLWTKPAITSGAKPTRDLSSVNNLEWHGLMLTLSHLLYRRSPPAAQLSDIIHALLLGLSFEQRSTSGTSVGANVRDAACFGIWAVARRYTTDELLAVSTQSVFAARSHPPTSSVIQVLATELVTTACLDPAGNIRRGASAALQELIGRHPNTVEQGISVVQMVDYHAVARRSRALREVAQGAAELSAQYGEAVVDGILGWRGVGDVDGPSRRYSASAFGSLTAELARVASANHLFAVVRQINSRFKLLANRQAEERHGLLLCYAAVVEQMPRFMKGRGSNDSGADEETLIWVISSVSGILQDCHEGSFRRPELVAEAASRLVIALVPFLQSIAANDLTQDMPQLRAYLDRDQPQKLEDLVTVLDLEPRAAALTAFISALNNIVPMWLSRTEQEAIEPVSEAALTLLLFSDPASRSRLLSDWTNIIRSKPSNRNTPVDEGYLLTLAMAQPLAEAEKGEESDGTIDSVCQAFLDRWEADEDVLTRVAILQSLTKSHILLDKSSLFLRILSDGLNDYTTTARGDVGSHVRVAALQAVQKLWTQTTSGADNIAWSNTALQSLIYNVLRLAAERLDRVRPEAQAALALALKEEHQEAFRSLTFSSQRYFETLLGILESGHCRPEVEAVIQADAQLWMSELLAGFVTSADTGNEDLIIASRAALCAYTSASPDNLKLTASALLHNLKTRQSWDRVIIPTLEITGFLFTVGIFQQAADVVDFKKVCLQAQKAGYKTGSLRKLEACVRVYGGIAAMREQTPAVQEARKRLGALLYHPWPKVRGMVVERLWSVLDEDGLARQEDLLSVDWGRADKTQVKTLVEQLGLA